MVFRLSAAARVIALRETGLRDSPEPTHTIEPDRTMLARVEMSGLLPDGYLAEGDWGCDGGEWSLTAHLFASVRLD